ncbi:PREDICTED: coiled-coil domain-containing protein 134-like [Habropoda laboriosa]|uniref:coiled-coil domain-containing protein 134-like n=1 Tax=Habropoda laboriosa TaxID=597456 RepID=UPI00083D0590|nr:PREDICTED: coiled-coil domain-containing protein 134-like [Habropoda laboriosa]
MPRVLLYIVIVSMLTYITHAQHNLPAVETQQISGKSENNNSSSEIKVYEKLFKKSFGYQRKEHMQVIKRLQKIDSYERLYKMIMVLGEKMIDVIEASKALIENGGFNPDNRTLPRNVTIQSAISTTLENTAFFGDIILHFPHITHRILRTQQIWNPIIHWSLNFMNRTKYLLDTETVERFHLVSQELNIVKREPEYFNPYWHSAESRKEYKGEAKKKKSTRKEKQKRGPQITKVEL